MGPGIRERSLFISQRGWVRGDILYKYCNAAHTIIVQKSEREKKLHTLQFVIGVFPDHTHYFFMKLLYYKI